MSLIEKERSIAFAAIFSLKSVRMKLLKRKISSKDGSGSVLLQAEVSEDLWHAYNLLQEGDMVRCTTVRKVMKESSTGSTSSSKVRMSLTIEVSKIDFDTESQTVRLSGPNREESNFVKMGAFHTLTLEVGRTFRIEKLCWDQIFLDRIDEACHPDRGAEVAAAVMQTGVANLCLLTDYMTIVKAKIDVNIPKKRSGSSNHAKAVKKFYEALYQAILRHVDFTKVKCVLLASPGFVKDDFFKFLQTESVRRDDRPFIENKAKFVLCKASSGHKHALEEIFSDPSIVSRLNDTKMAKEVDILNKFMRMIDTNPDKAFYGYNHVNLANENTAIESLLITDQLFRNPDVTVRKQYVRLVESVRENGGQVFVFSTLHVSGTQLQEVSGVAAILRFPMSDLMDQLDSSDESEEILSKDDFKDKNDIKESISNLQQDLDYMGF